MIQTMATLMVGALMMGAVVIIAGVLIMSKQCGETPEEFVLGFFKGFVRGLVAPQTGPAVAAAPQQLDVLPIPAPETPARPGKASAIVLLLLAVLYLLSPLDSIPDLIPGLCHLDDLGIMTLAVRNAMKTFS